MASAETSKTGQLAAVNCEVRPPETPAELAEFCELLISVYGMPVASAANWIEQSGGLAGQRVAVDRGGRVVAGLTAIPMAQYFRGRAWPCLGISGVVVRADARRRGWARRLLEVTLCTARDEGMVCSALYAATPALYRGLGFEKIAAYSELTLAPSQIPRLAGPVDVEELDLDDGRALDRVHRLASAMAGRRHGAFERRGLLRFRATHRLDGRALRALMLAEDRGYIVYDLQSVDGGVTQRLRIRDVEFCSGLAVEQLWSTIADQCSLATEIIMPSAHADPMFQALLTTVDALKVRDCLWLRVLDPAPLHAALVERGVEIPGDWASVAGPGERADQVSPAQLSPGFAARCLAGMVDELDILEPSTRTLTSTQLDALRWSAPWSRDRF